MAHFDDPKSVLRRRSAHSPGRDRGRIFSEKTIVLRNSVFGFSRG
jgi:hypothetical protein